MDIREAVTADRPALLDLWVNAWAAAMPDIDFGARRLWFADRLDILAREGAAILVAVGPTGRPVGFVSVHPGKQEVDQLAVDVTAQRVGIGARLLDEAKHRSPAGLTLTVNEHNPGAVALYAREGFAVTGRGTNALSGLPVLHMRWVPGTEVRSKALKISASPIMPTSAP